MIIGYLSSKVKDGGNRMYKDFYFEVRNGRGRLQATFARRYEAEKYAEGHSDFVVLKIDLN